MISSVWKTESRDRGLDVLIVSYKAWRHPRALKIYKSLKLMGLKAGLWSPRQPFTRGPRIIRGLLNYLLALIEVSLLNARLIWVENVPDIIYLPLAVLRRRYVYDRRSPWAKQLEVEFPWFSKIPFAPAIVELVERYLAKQSEAIVVVSRAMAYEFDYEGHGKKVYVLPNYPEKKFAETRPLPMREKLGVPRDVIIFGFVGRLSRMEGADLLVKIAPLICQSGRAELWIIGDGPLAAGVRKLKGKYPCIRWFGWIEHGEIPSFLRSFDFGLVPRHKHKYSIFYTHEGVHKVSEYLVHGVKVIASGMGPSEYYLNVEEDELPQLIASILRGERRSTWPSTRSGAELTWESHCTKVVNSIVRDLGILEGQ